jgi:hypothetical protein
MNLTPSPGAFGADLSPEGRGGGCRLDLIETRSSLSSQINFDDALVL